MILKKTLPLVFLCTLGLWGKSLDKVVKNVLENNPEVKAIVINTDAYKEYINEQKASYYPSVDVQAYVEKIDEKTKKKDSPSVREKRDGAFVEVNLEQVLFEGGARSARVDEQTYKYNANKYLNINKLDLVIHNLAKSYLDYAKYKELVDLSKTNLKVQNDYLSTAVENEEVSGSSLERMQVESKISYSKSKLQQQQNFRDAALSKLEKYTSFPLKNSVCRPLVDAKKIPTSLPKLYEIALLNNNELKEQRENVNVQKTLIEQEKAKFRPRVVAKLKQQYDDGLDVNDSTKNETSGRIELNYNLFNGFKDNSSLEKERKFLLESKATLNALEKSVKDKIKTAFIGYANAKKRIEYLKSYVAKNEEILKIYTEQFEGGTRSFIDILNHENEIYRSKQELIDEEYNLYLNYFDILLNYGEITKAVLNSKQKQCLEVKYPYESRKIALQAKTDNEVSDLLEGGDSSSNLESELKIVPDMNVEAQKEVDNSKEVKAMMNSIMKEIYNGEKAEKSADEILIDLRKKEKELPKIKLEKDEVIDIDIQNNNIEDDTNTSLNLSQEFENLNTKYFTIVIASIQIKNDEDLNKFLNRNKISDNAYSFKIGADKKYTRILYGAFKTVALAEEKLGKLSPKLLKTNKSFVGAIKKQQKIFSRYN